MTPVEYHVLSAPPESRDELCQAADTYGGHAVFASALSRKSMTSMGRTFRSVFAVNVNRSWSIGRLVAVARMVNADATVACTFAQPRRIDRLDHDDFSRWFARTPGAFLAPGVDPWQWATERRSSELAPSSTSPATARSFIQSALSDWHCTSLAADAALVASELVTNAIEHSSSSVVPIDIARRDPYVYLAVRDNALLNFPIIRRPPQGSRAGRGLRIVASYSMWWGVTITPGHKVVWAEFATDAR